MNDDRSERLRKRRSESAKRREADKPDETGDSAETGEQDEPSKSSKLSETEEQSQQSEQSVKEEQVGTYMYLPESQKREMERVYTVMKAEYEYEFEEDFEKNRHFYPLVIQYGLDELDGLDTKEIRDRLYSPR